MVGKVPLSADGLVGLWDEAWSATQRAMGYSVEALSQTRDIGAFLRAVKPQAEFTKLIRGEVSELVGIRSRERKQYSRGLLPAEKTTIMRWHHDRFATQATTLYGIAELSQYMPNLEAGWYERARKTYAFNPSLSHIINGVVEAHEHTLLEKDIAIEVDVESTETFFANRRIRQLTTDIITNLISNAVKYSRPGGMIRVGFYDNKLIVEDNGVGMDVLFAQRLGQSAQIRENRAHDVHGYGFGWTTIGKALGELGWRYAIETEPNVGSKITVTMLGEHVRNHSFMMPSLFVADIDLFGILAQGNDILNGVEPLASYHIAGNFLDVSESPAAWVIEAINKVDAQYAIAN